MTNHGSRFFALALALRLAAPSGLIADVSPFPIHTHRIFLASSTLAIQAVVPPVVGSWHPMLSTARVFLCEAVRRWAPFASLQMAYLPAFHLHTFGLSLAAVLPVGHFKDEPEERMSPRLEAMWTLVNSSRSSQAIATELQRNYLDLSPTEANYQEYAKENDIIILNLRSSPKQRHRTIEHLLMEKLLMRPTSHREFHLTRQLWDSQGSAMVGLFHKKDAKQLEAIATKSKNYYIVISAFDFLYRAKFKEILKRSTSNMQRFYDALFDEDVEHVPQLLIILSRIDAKRLRGLRGNDRLLLRLNRAYGSKPLPKELLETMFDLLTHYKASPLASDPREKREEHLKKLRDRKEKLDDLLMFFHDTGSANADANLQATLVMLAILHYMADSPDLPSLIKPDDIYRAHEAITREVWVKDDESVSHIDFVRRAEQTGLCLHSAVELDQVFNHSPGKHDPAVDYFLAFLFRYGFLKSAEFKDLAQYSNIDLSVEERAVLFKAVEENSPLMSEPGFAARAQLAALVECGVDLRLPNWSKFYRGAMINNSRVRGSLSELGHMIMKLYSDKYGIQLPAVPRLAERNRRADQREGRWRVYIPLILPETQKYMDDAAFVGTVTETHAANLMQIWATFRRYEALLASRSHFEHWKTLGPFQFKERTLKIIRGEKVAPMVVHGELHEDARCPDDCAWCHGERGRGTAFMEDETFFKVADELKTLKPHDELSDFESDVFIRLSGDIGDPGVRKTFGNLLAHLNNLDIPWGVTQNGLGLAHYGVIPASMQSVFVQVSLDSFSEATYTDPEVKGGHPGAFTQLINENIPQLFQERRNTQSPTRIAISFLLDRKTVHELEPLAEWLSGLDDNFILQVKMQHPSKFHMPMTAAQVSEVYDKILPRIRARFRAKRNQRLAVLQTKDRALQMIAESQAPHAASLVQITSTPMPAPKPRAPMPFERCFLTDLGIITISPESIVESCCQYAAGATLGPIGSLVHASMRDILENDKRVNDTRKCEYCSPTDWILNSFMKFVQEVWAFDRRECEMMVDELQRLAIHVLSNAAAVRRAA